jgi:hypothetical protein
MDLDEMPPAKRLGICAMEFRSTRNEAERISIARAYSQAVNELIAGGNGDRFRLSKISFPMSGCRRPSSGIGL